MGDPSSHQERSLPTAPAPVGVARLLGALTRAAERFAAQVAVQSSLESVVGSLVADFDAALARILIHDPVANELRLQASAGASCRHGDALIGRVDLATSALHVAEVARTRRAFVKNGLDEAVFEPAWVAREGIHSVVQLPLVAGDRLHGVLMYFGRTPVDETGIEVLTALAAMLAGRLERERLGHELATSREESARLVETTEQRLESVISHTPVVLFVMDLEGRITLSEGRGLEALGLEPKEVVGRSVFDLYGEHPNVVAACRRALAGEEFTILNEVGQLCFETRFRPMRDRAGTLLGSIGVATDVTERHRAARELERQRRDHEIILSLVPALIFFKDDSNRILRANQTAAHAAGKTIEEMTGRRAEEIYPAEQAAKYHADDLEVIRSGKPKLGIIEPHTGANGETIWVRTDKIPYRDESGKVVGVVVSAVDITQLKRAEEALSAEKERLAVTLASIGDGVIATDTHGRVVLLNKVAEELTGLSQAEAAGRPVSEVLELRDEKTGELLPDPVAPILAEGERAGHAPLAAIQGPGGRRWIVAERGAPIRREGGAIEGAVLVLRDMSERKRLEDELVKAAKLESIGLLAAGIAHDFNNILTAITANLSLAKLSLRPRDEPYALLNEIEGAALRARELTHELLVFAKGGAPVKRTTAIAAILQDSASFALRGSNVRCDLSLPPDLWPVDVDQAQMGQVVHNLVLNAQQAMPAGGVIAIRASNGVVEGQDPSLPPGRYVKIEIEDHGAGIGPEHLSRIFDPFFTTKVGGTGLGLTTTYSIVRRHDGHISVRSEVDKGTIFEIRLPASQHAVPPKEPALPPPMRGRGRLLVMDDDQRIRSVVGQILQHFGFEAEFARDGVEAVELYEAALREGRRFDAVLMDLTIPGGMGGKEAMARILELDPGAKGIVSSGYSNDPVMAEYARFGFRALIAKPYRIEDLGRVLGSVLAEKA